LVLFPNPGGYLNKAEGLLTSRFDSLYLRQQSIAILAEFAMVLVSWIAATVAMKISKAPITT